MPTVQDCFAEFDLPSSATPEEIRRRYRELAKRYHPDANGDMSADERKQRADKFGKISEAYEVLSDPTNRVPVKKRRRRLFVVYNDVKIRVQYHNLPDDSRAATLFVDLDDVDKLSGLDGKQVDAELGLQAPISRWWVMQGDTQLFEVDDFVRAFGNRW